MFCQTCGMANPDSRQFCSKCGKPLPSAAARVTPAPAAVRAGSSSEAPPPFTGDAPTSGKAIASLVCGVFTFFLPASVAAIILGHISLSEIRNSAGRIGGRGLATTGLVLGYLGLVIIPVMIVAAIAVPNLLHARVAANEASAVGSLRSINTAAMVYADKVRKWISFQPGRVWARAQQETSTCNQAAMLDASVISGRKSRIHLYLHSAISGMELPHRSFHRRPPRKAASLEELPATRVTADPLQRGTTGMRSFFTDQTGVIRFSGNGRTRHRR